MAEEQRLLDHYSGAADAGPPLPSGVVERPPACPDFPCRPRAGGSAGAPPERPSYASQGVGARSLLERREQREALGCVIGPGGAPGGVAALPPRREHLGDRLGVEVLERAVRVRVDRTEVAADRRVIYGFGDTPARAIGRWPFDNVKRSIMEYQSQGGPFMEETSQTPSVEPFELADDEWRERLTPDQYRVLRQKGTDPAFTGRFTHPGPDGQYRCAACGTVLFDSATQFDSGSGWPSFTEPANLANVELHTDTSLGMVRTEVTCKHCGGHLGHLFDDGPSPAGQRWCINSSSLELDPDRG